MTLPAYGRDEPAEPRQVDAPDGQPPSPESAARLRQAFGERFNQLTPLEVQTLVTADIEGEVSNPRMRVVCDQHPADLTKMLQGLVNKGLLTRDGQGRWTTYRLPAIPQSGESIPQSGQSIPQSEEQLPPEVREALQAIPEASRPRLIPLVVAASEKTWRKEEETRSLITDLCRGCCLNAEQIAVLLGRDRDKTLERFLTPMVEEGLLETDRHGVGGGTMRRR